MHTSRDYTRTSHKYSEPRFNENLGANSTAKRRLKSSSSSRALNSIDPYNIPLGKHDETVSTFRNTSGNLVGYGYPKTKVEIDEKFHRDFKDKLAELETLKYQHGKLKDVHELTLQRLETLEGENNTLTKKYEKAKNSYLLLKEQYGSIKATFIDAQNEDKENIKQIKALEDRLDNLSQEKEDLEQENSQLAAQIESLYINNKEENRNYLDLELKYQLDTEKLQKEKNEIRSELEDVQQRLQREIQLLKDEKDEVIDEKTSLTYELNSFKEKYMESLETINTLKAEARQQTVLIHKLGRENNILMSESRPTQRFMTLGGRSSYKYEYEGESNTEYDDLPEQYVHSHRLHDRGILRHKENHSKDQRKLRLASEENQLRDENETLKQVLDSVQAELLDVKRDLQSERVEHKDEVEAFKDTFEKKCELYQQEVTGLKAKISELAEDKENILNESTAAKFDFNFFEGQMTQFQEIIYKLESENEKLQNDLYSKRHQPVINEDRIIRDSLQERSLQSNSLNYDQKQHRAKPDGHSSVEIKRKSSNNEQKEQLSYSESDVSGVFDRITSKDKEDNKETEEDIENRELDKALAEYRIRSHRESKAHVEGDIKEEPSTQNGLAHKQDFNKDFEEDLVKASLMSATKELKRLNAKYNEIRAKYAF